MSMMLCEYCQEPCDTDEDPDSLYVKADTCVCRWCRDDLGVESEFDA